MTRLWLCKVAFLNTHISAGMHIESIGLWSYSAYILLKNAFFIRSRQSEFSTVMRYVALNYLQGRFSSHLKPQILYHSIKLSIIHSKPLYTVITHCLYCFLVKQDLYQTC